MRSVACTRCSIPSGEASAGRRNSRSRLFELREKRPKPLRDDKVIASWNGLALAALAESARRLQRDDLLTAARELGAFLLGPLSTDEGRLFRTWRAGRAHTTGFLEDYADVANGLYELHVATGDLRWLEEARRLALLAVELFADDERGGFFHTPADGEALVNRKKELDDHPTPSGNATLAVHACGSWSRMTAPGRSPAIAACAIARGTAPGRESPVSTLQRTSSRLSCRASRSSA